MAVKMGKMVGQHQQIAIAFAQGRRRDLQHVQTIIKIFTKAFFLDRSLEIDMGRRQHSHIHRNRLTAAHPLDVFFLEEA
ncbi:hypothetical protein D3C75_1157410 [compost metagenome]